MTARQRPSSSRELPAAELAPDASGILQYDGAGGWAGVSRLPYKQGEDGPFRGIARCQLAAPDPASFELRYFELEPGGYTSLERHRHVHVVVGLRGRGRVRIGAEAHAVRSGHVVQIASRTEPQFSNDSAEPFGFLCIVDRERDRPEPLEDERESEHAHT
jgi:quercetin dioxygenase-like cupin family protein